MKPIYEPKFINTSVLDFEELEIILNNFEPSSIELINNNFKEPFVLEKFNENSSVIVSNARRVKPIFNNLINVFKEKFPILKSCKSYDVHIYASPSNKSSTFGTHVDTSHTIILQTQGLCKWVLPNNFEKIIECGDILWLPKGTIHGCIPLSKRISLSFAFWEK